MDSTVAEENLLWVHRTALFIAIVIENTINERNPSLKQVIQIAYVTDVAGELTDEDLDED